MPIDGFLSAWVPWVRLGYFFGPILCFQSVVGFVRQNSLFCRTAGDFHLQNLQGAVVLAFETDFVAVQNVEAAGVVGEAAESERGAHGGGFAGDFTRLALDFLSEVHGVEGPDAELAPFGRHHGFQETELGIGFGLEFVEHAVVELVKTVGRFAFGKQGSAKEAVAFGVAGGVSLALFGDGSAGFGSVGFGGGYLQRRSHIFIYGMEMGGLIVGFIRMGGAAEKRASLAQTGGSACPTFFRSQIDGLFFGIGLFGLREMRGWIGLLLW